MDELDLFRGFRTGVEAPGPAAKRQASARLRQAIEQRQGRGTRVLRLVQRRPGRTALALAVVAGAAAAALFVSAPWKGSPGFLERAQAALTPPAGSILHYRYEETQSAEALGCTVRTGPREVWIDQAPPHRYRALLPYVGVPEPRAADIRSRVCRDHPVSEVGGAMDTRERPLVFVPPDTLKMAAARYLSFSTDPAADLRRAIENDTAYREGTAELDGRKVERIRVDPPDPQPCPDRPCPTPPRFAYHVYVDSETFDLVQEEWPNIVVRYLTFEYLPRTPANVALTDIRAQHPDATGP